MNLADVLGDHRVDLIDFRDANFDTLERFNISIQSRGEEQVIYFSGTGVRIRYSPKSHEVIALELTPNDHYPRSCCESELPEQFDLAEKIVRDPSLLLDGPDTETLPQPTHPIRRLNATLTAYFK